MEQQLNTESEVEVSTIIFGGINIYFSIVFWTRSKQHKIICIIDIYKLSLVKTKNCTFFSSLLGIFTKISYTVGHKTNFKIF